MRWFCDSKMDQGFFQVSSFQPTIQSQRHMLPKRGPCLARHTSTSAGGSPAADSPPTRKRPAPTSGPEAMPPRRSPRLVEDLLCNRPASQGNSSPAKSSARVKAWTAQERGTAGAPYSCSKSSNDSNQRLEEDGHFKQFAARQARRARHHSGRTAHGEDFRINWHRPFEA